MAAAVAAALDVPLARHGWATSLLRRSDPLAQLGHAIAGRGPCLVVLDNFEQLVEHAAATVGRWLERAEQASFLVTSRQRLGLAAEDTLAPAPLREEEGIALFLERARALQKT